MRCFITRLVGVVCLLGPSISAISSTERASLQVHSRLVRVPVTVTDGRGAPLTDLRQDDFRVFENSEARPIVSFSREDAPASIAIVLDLSGSMAGKLGHATAAIREITSALEPEDEAALMVFAEKPVMLSRFTRQTAYLANRLNGLAAGGSTALIDSVYLALNELSAVRGPRRAMIIISDGADNYSAYTESELMQLASEADAQIYGISIVENALSSDEKRGASLLHRLSAATGGYHHIVRHRGELPETAQKLLRVVKHLYVIAYKPLDSDAPGNWRKIRVTVDAALRNSSWVSARSGYFAP